MRKALPTCLVSSPLLGGEFEAGLPFGLAGSLVIYSPGDSGYGTVCPSDPLGLPQVNNTVVPLGEMRGYAPFSPDENSLVLFEGRAALQQGLQG